MRRDPRSVLRWSLAPLLLRHAALDKEAQAPAPSAPVPRPPRRGVASPVTVLFQLHERRHPPSPTQRAFKAQIAGPTHRFF